MRYWAASGRPGTDTAFDAGQMKIGRRLAIKILNASKFVLGLGARERRLRRSPSRSTGRCSPGWPDVVAEATEPFEDYNYARALELTETFFWNFCDDYVELVKDRAYGGQGRGRGSIGQGRARRSRCQRAAAPVRAVPAVHDRGGLVVVAGGLGAPRSPGRTSGAVTALAADGDAGARRRRRRRAHRGAQGQVRDEGVHARRRLDGHRDRSPRGRQPACARPPATSAPSAGSRA